MRRMINLLWVVVHIFTERCPLLGALGCVSRLCGEEGVGAHPGDGGDQEPGEGQQRGREHGGGDGDHCPHLDNQHNLESWSRSKYSKPTIWNMSREFIYN